MNTTTTRAYTLSLSGDQRARQHLWSTHVAVNRATWVWGDWLLTLRGGLPAALAQARPERQVVLALSWLSVESPASLSPPDHVIAHGSDDARTRAEKVHRAFLAILYRHDITNVSEWERACLPALTARIRDDAVWVDRHAAFQQLSKTLDGQLTAEWGASTFLDLIGGEANYFQWNQAGGEDSAPGAAPVPPKDFIQKAVGWLSRNWGSGQKSDSAAIAHALTALAATKSAQVVGQSGDDALLTLLRRLHAGSCPADAEATWNELKGSIGWKGRPSKGLKALEKLRDAAVVDLSLWTLVARKLTEEAHEHRRRADQHLRPPHWMPRLRQLLESRFRMDFRVGRDLIWEQGVALDHALRRVSITHNWVKLAETTRRTFHRDADAIQALPPAAVARLDQFCEDDRDNSLIGARMSVRRSTLKRWSEIVQAWGRATDDPDARVRALRDLALPLPEGDPWGNALLFETLAGDDAKCLWNRDGEPDSSMLKTYFAARTAEFDQRRLKVPIYRHPDPLRHPIFVDFGNSRWGIEYSALTLAQKLAQKRKRHKRRPASANSAAFVTSRSDSDRTPDLHNVMLSLWTGSELADVVLHWHSKRLRRDFGFNHFGLAEVSTVSRADRLGRAVADQPRAPVSVAAVFDQKAWNGRLQAPRRQLDRLADHLYSRGDENQRGEPSYDTLDTFSTDLVAGTSMAAKICGRLRWLLTLSVKLEPAGPCLDYIRRGLPPGTIYRKGQNGRFFDFDANKHRKGRSRLKLCRLPGFRVLSFQLCERSAAACAVWETLTAEQMIAACRQAQQRLPRPEDVFLHLETPSDRIQATGRRKGEPVVQKTIYRRVGADLLPDGRQHPAPWARLDRQFFIKLPGEERPARWGSVQELEHVRGWRAVLGLPSGDLAETPESSPEIKIRVDQLMQEIVRDMRQGLWRLNSLAGSAAGLLRVQRSHPEDPLRASGGQWPPSARVDSCLDALLTWYQLAHAEPPKLAVLRGLWDQEFAGDPAAALLPDALSTIDEAVPTQLAAVREQLRPLAARLADGDQTELHALLVREHVQLTARWQQALRWLRDWLLPRGSALNRGDKTLFHVGGLSLGRIGMLRELYDLAQAFKTRPEPLPPSANPPQSGGPHLANFGRRMRDQFERLREQRVKQLASRIVEAALGVGSEDPETFPRQSTPARENC